MEFEFFLQGSNLLYILQSSVYSVICYVICPYKVDLMTNFWKAFNRSLVRLFGQQNNNCARREIYQSCSVGFFIMILMMLRNWKTSLFCGFLFKGSIHRACFPASVGLANSFFMAQLILCKNGRGKQIDVSIALCYFVTRLSLVAFRKYSEWQPSHKLEHYCVFVSIFRELPILINMEDKIWQF